MPLHQAPSEGGGRRRHVHWVYVSTAANKKWSAWIAGPCHWYECHDTGRTKPCLHAISGGELHCDICSPLKQPVPVGYQPLYRESDGRPCMVIVHDYSREQVDALKLHQQVWVSRGDGITDAVSINPMLSGGCRYKSSLADRMRPADLTCSLLAIWKIPRLVEWYSRTNGRGDTAVSLPPPPGPPPPPAPPPPELLHAKGPLDRLREAEERRLREEEEEKQHISSTMDHLLNGKLPKNGAFKKR